MSDLKLQAIITVANKASAPLRKINSDLNRMRAPIRGLTRAVKGLDRASGFKELRRSVKGLTGGLTKLSLVGAGAATAGFVAINKMAEAGDNIIKTATAVGMSTDALQEWRFVAERSGASTAAMDKSMQAFTKRMAEARGGTGELYSLLNRENPVLLDQLLAIKDNDKAFDHMIKTISKLGDQQSQILLADKSFSESGRDLVKVTAQGSEEIERLKKELRDMGGILNREVLKRSVDFKDEMTGMGIVTRKLAFTFGAELLPAVSGIMKEMQVWMKSLNKDDIRQFGKDAAESIKGFAKWIKEVSPKVLAFVKSIGGIKAVVIGVGAVLTGPLLSAIATLGAALLATPFGLLATVAVGAVGMITGAFNPLATYFPELWSGIVNTVGKFIADQIAEIKEFIGYISQITKQVRGFFGLANNSQVRPPSDIRTVARDRRQSAAGYGVNPSKPNLLASQSAQKVNNEVKGRIVIDVRGDAKVRSIKSDNSGIDLGVDSGMSFAAAL
jgi:hypothetical protein